jgi:hypothetical protein
MQRKQAIMNVFLSVTDPYYEMSDPPEEEPDIADWADDWEPEGDPFEFPLATAESVSDLQSAPVRKEAAAQLNLFEEVA